MEYFLIQTGWVCDSVNIVIIDDHNDCGVNAEIWWYSLDQPLEYWLPEFLAVGLIMATIHLFL